MTAKQKANQERFKKVVAEASKLRKKNPKLTQAQAVKQAWAISYGKIEKIGYKSDRLTILKRATNQIKKYKAKGWSRADQVRNANIDAAYMTGAKATPTKVKAKKGKKTSEMHTDTKSHNVNIRVVSGVKLNEYQKQFIREEKQESGQGYTYRAKILRGQPILLKEKNNIPIQKWYFEFDIAQKIAEELNKYNKNFSYMSGMSKGKEKMIEMWSNIYGRLASDLIVAKTIKEKNIIRKEMKIAKEILQKLKKIK